MKYGAYKYVRLSTNEIRIISIWEDHPTAVKEGGTPISAGMLMVNDDFFRIEGRSMLLNLGMMDGDIELIKQTINMPHEYEYNS